MKKSKLSNFRRRIDQIDESTEVSPAENNDTVDMGNADSYKTYSVDTEIESYLSLAPGKTIVNKEKVQPVSKQQVKDIMARISKTHDISIRTAYIATSEMFRRGAANAGAPDSMSLDIECQDTGYATELRRYDLVMALHAVMGYKNIRKLAEAIAPEILKANLSIIKDSPLVDLKGDLANRINLKLHLRHEEALSRKEEICCCTYAQWLPNLNDLAESTRLKGLLEEDLNARRKKSGKQSLEKEKKKKAQRDGIKKKLSN